MSELTFEQVRISVKSWPPEERAKLRKLLDQPDEEDAPKATMREAARAASLRDFTADRQWLADHRDEYAGQWVALKYGELLSHGASAKEVHQAAKDAGHLDALLVRVEASDAPPFIL